MPLKERTYFKKLFNLFYYDQDFHVTFQILIHIIRSFFGISQLCLIEEFLSKEAGAVQTVSSLHVLLAKFPLSLLLHRSHELWKRRKWRSIQFRVNTLIINFSVENEQSQNLHILAAYTFSVRRIVWSYMYLSSYITQVSWCFYHFIYSLSVLHIARGLLK